MSLELCGSLWYEYSIAGEEGVAYPPVPVSQLDALVTNTS